MTAAVPKLNAGETVVPMRQVAHVSEIAHVAFIPDARRGVGILVGLGVNGAVLGEHHTPTPFGLCAAQRRLRPRPLGARAGTMGGLEEAIARALRPDLDAFEEDVVLGIPCHGQVLLPAS
jgi:hypothetical protein